VALGQPGEHYAIPEALFQLIRLHHPKATIVTATPLVRSIPEMVLSRTEADVCVVGEGDEDLHRLIQPWTRTPP